MIRRIFLKTVPLLFNALFATSAIASTFTDGITAYHAHDYPTAVSDFQAAAAQSSGPSAGKDDYMLGLALHHEGKNTDAVNEYSQAQKADPSLSFASSPQDFQHNLQVAQKDSATKGSYVPTGSAGTAPTTDQAAYALTTGDVYVAPDFPGQVNQTHLADAAADESAPVKIAVLNHLPSGYSNPTQYAQKLNEYLHIGHGSSVIVVAVNGQGRGIADYSDSMSHDQEKAIADKYVAKIGTGDYNGGVYAMAQEVSATSVADYHRPMTILTDVFMFVVLAVILLIWMASRRKKTQLASVIAPTRAQTESVVDGIAHLDEYIDVLPKNNADTDQVKAFRQAAAYKLDQAEKILARSTELSDVARASSILQQASMDVSNGTKYLNRVTGGASTQSEPIKPTPFPTTQAAAAQIPDDKRGVSFFSSQPATVSQLTPVTLTIDGQQKTVMATPQEASMVQRGQIPPVRSFNVGGQSVPWYAYQNYDPYNDYYTYQNNGWRGVAGGAIAGFIGAELLDSLFQPRPYWGGGWNSPYAYGPGWDSYGGWNDYGWGGNGFNSGYNNGFIQGENQANAQNYAFQDQYSNPAQDSNFGGASFMGGSQSGSPGYDQSDYGNSSGASFMGGDHS